MPTEQTNERCPHEEIKCRIGRGDASGSEQRQRANLQGVRRHSHDPCRP